MRGSDGEADREGCLASATSVDRGPWGLNPGAVLELGEHLYRAWPRIASPGGAGIGSSSAEDDLVQGPFQQEEEFAVVRQGQGRYEP